MDGEMQIKLLKYLKSDKYASLANVSKLLNVSKSTAKRYCDELQNSGLIYRANNNTPWDVCIDINDYDTSAKEVDLTRQKLIIDYMVDSPYSSNSESFSKSRSVYSYRSIRNNLRKDEVITKYKKLEVRRIKQYYFFHDNVLCDKWVTIKCGDEPLFKMKCNDIEAFLEDCKNKFLSLERVRSSVWNYALNIICNDITNNNITLSKVLEHYISILLLVNRQIESTETQVLNTIKDDLESLFQDWTLLSSKPSPEMCYELFSENEIYKSIYWIFWCLLIEALKTGKIARLPVYLYIKE